jgi:hypothetical protein
MYEQERLMPRDDEPRWEKCRTCEHWLDYATELDYSDCPDENPCRACRPEIKESVFEEPQAGVGVMDEMNIAILDVESERFRDPDEPGEHPDPDEVPPEEIAGVERDLKA